jgi:PEP-CTERM motif-containing protein
MQSFRWAIRFGICMVLGLPAFAGNVYNFDLANQYASGAINTAAAFTVNQSNQNISITAAGYAQQGGVGAYQGASLYENTSAAAGAAAGLGLNDGANSNKISQSGHAFLQLDISNLLSAASSAGLNNVGISISGVDPSKDSFLLFGGSTKGSFVGSTVLAYGNSDSTVNLNLYSLIAKNFDFISILAPDGGVLVNGIKASYVGNAAQFMAAPAIGANTPEPSTTMLFGLSALLISGFLLRRRRLVARSAQS